MAISKASGSMLRAHPGDRLVVRGHHVGERERDGEILEVLGASGGPPFVVRWSDDGHVSRLFPGSDAFVDHVGEHGSATEPAQGHASREEVRREKRR